MSRKIKRFGSTCLAFEESFVFYSFSWKNECFVPFPKCSNCCSAFFPNLKKLSHTKNVKINIPQKNMILLPFLKIIGECILSEVCPSILFANICQPKTHMSNCKKKSIIHFFLTLDSFVVVADFGKNQT